MNDIKISKFKDGVNYWEANPDLLAIEVFRNLRDHDFKRNKSTKDSSKLMWAVYLIWDYRSLLSRMRIDYRISYIEKDFLKDEGFFKSNWDFVKPIVDTYNFLQKDSERRALEEIDALIDSRMTFISVERRKISAKNYKMLDDMAITTEKLLEQRDRIIAKLSGKDELIVRGGLQLGLLAKNEFVRPEVEESKKHAPGLSKRTL